jgi:hypothetical protein
MMSCTAVTEGRSAVNHWNHTSGFLEDCRHLPAVRYVAIDSCTKVHSYEPVCLVLTHSTSIAHPVRDWHALCCILCIT